MGVCTWASDRNNRKGRSAFLVSKRHTTGSDMTICIECANVMVPVVLD